MSEAFDTFISVLQIITASVMFYHIIIAFFSKKNSKTKTKKISNNSEASDKKKLRLAIITAAHNEEKVIFETVKSIFGNDYPKKLFEVFVVADNCTDKTAEVAKNAGATVWERNDSAHIGKGYAIFTAFKKILSEEKQYDAVVIIDADNITDKNFLKETACSLQGECMAVQGCIKAKNPYSSWVSAAYHITHLCLNTLYQKARHNIDFPVQLNGTGFALKTELIKNLSWDLSCLTEDMEITVKMALSGIYASYNENAVVYDEKPVDFKTSYNQRIRWMQGQSDVLSRFAVPLIKNQNKVSTLKLLDCAIYLVQPYIFVLSGITAVLSLANFFEGGFIPTERSFFTAIWTTIQFLAIPFYLTVIQKEDIKILKYYIPYLIFIYSWIPVSFMGIINRKKKNWFHTKHTVCISND